MRLLHGRPLAERLNARSRERSDALRARDIHPALAAISVGIDPAANTYLQRLVRGGKAIGIAVRDISLSRDTTEPTVMAELDRASRDPEVHGVLLLTPLPGKLDEGHLVDHIAAEKDVEGVNPYNVGLLLDGRPRFVPSTAEAIVELLKFHEIRLGGVDVVVVGRSTVVGRPAAALLLNEDATVTVAHKQTSDVAAVTRRAAVVIVAVGRAAFLTGDMISPGATVIDAGINVTPAGVAGDV
ncbi:MAG TPA: bifunctional 5,10-methylenetetrahydrofolate dehydrogenase/5,10-methenyltetrahydrofolate cyclohydrolase, partial [Candidatus Limnocylindria bacterium]|nr:bifunctional 5,10-methylenetetrahydrofolate dehydrogenase/5,10-methenyltetrahydrofolate cyclohydrolase [Candidatus Limnocylindria bacterium]